MNLVFAISRHGGARLAEIGFLLFVIAGLWLSAAQLPIFRLSRLRTFIAGLLIAVGGALLIVAVHWGHFG
ncbi:MAG TPA: hypothetical protein VGL76_01385 [Gaiellaceae bacterium]